MITLYLNINKGLSKLCNNFKKIESELSVSKNVNCKLHERGVALDRQCWGNSQYSRHECLEITGVPDSISNDDLEETTLKIFDKLDVTINPSNIEDCHWLKSNGPENAKKRWSNKYIHALWVSHRILRLKLTMSGCVHVIIHSQDLDELFPKNELLEGRTIGPLFVCLVYFHVSLWLFVFILKFQCSYLHIFNIFAAILLF